MSGSVDPATNAGAPSGPVAFVFAGGEGPPAALAPEARRAALVVAADSGLDHARSLGCRVDLVVGDLDSVSRGALDVARVTGTRIEEHPSDKDQSDLELALDAAVAHGVHRVVVAGGGGGRIDHAVGNLLLLASPRYAAVEVEQWSRDARSFVVRRPRRLDAVPGAVCSLFALGGPAVGVRTKGLRWPLHGERLEPGSTRGVSNVVEEPEVLVEVADGAVLVVLPIGATR